MEFEVIDGNNQNQVSNNEEDKVNITSKEDNLNQGINNQEKKSSKSKISKESPANFTNKDISKRDKKDSLNQGKITNKSTKMKISQKKVKNINPFLTDTNTNTLEYKHKKISKNKMNKNNGKMAYLKNFKNDKLNNSEIRYSITNRTVFSKISENMLKNSKEAIIPAKKPQNLELEGEKIYNQLTEEAYLCSCANKANRENKKIIEGFLGRKKNEEISKKMGVDSEKEKESQLETFQDVKRLNIVTDRNRSYISSRTFKEFLQDQKDKEEKHQNHLKTKENKVLEEMNSKIRDRPVLNEETKKLAMNSNRNGKDIHSRLYKEFDEKKKNEEFREKEKNIFQEKRKEIKKLSKVKIKENAERLFHEYESKKKRNNEIVIKKVNELTNMTNNYSTSKNSNEIILKRFKKILENSLKVIIEKKINEDFQINYLDFVKLLYKINFTSSNYFELIANKKNNANDDKNQNERNIKRNLKNRENRIIYRKTNYDKDREYKLIVDAWKIITQNKEFKKDMTGSSKRLFLFLFSVLGLNNGNINENFMKKEFSFMLESIKNINDSSANYSNLPKQIFKYYSLYRNNAINGLLFRERENKRRIELETEIEKNLTFAPNLEKSSKHFLRNNHSVKENRLSVEKNYEQYRKNKELKLKEKERMLEKEERKKCPFVPYGSKIKVKKNYKEISQRLYKTGLRHLKNSSSTPNNLLINDNTKKNTFEENKLILNSKNFSIQRMFNNNPLEKDMRIKKKIEELKDSRNKKNIEQLILKKGFIPKEDFKDNNELYEFNGLNYKNKRFAHDDEPLNNFKNTFQKYERLDKILGKREKYVFEIYVDKKPKNLIIYSDDDINYKVKLFCNVYKLNYNDKNRILQTIYQQLKGKIKCYY